MMGASVSTTVTVKEQVSVLPLASDTVNVTAPGLVEMGALLDAAGLAWTPRPAPAEAIPEVHLSAARLQRFVPLTAAAGMPHTLVAEWRGMNGT